MAKFSTLRSWVSGVSTYCVGHRYIPNNFFLDICVLLKFANSTLPFLGIEDHSCDNIIFFLLHSCMLYRNGEKVSELLVNSHNLKLI